MCVCCCLTTDHKVYRKIAARKGKYTFDIVIDIINCARVTIFGFIFKIIHLNSFFRAQVYISLLIQMSSKSIIKTGTNASTVTLALLFGATKGKIRYLVC